MHTLYSFQFLMVFAALALLIIPFALKKQIHKFLTPALFIAVGSFALYYFFVKTPELTGWLSQGKQHYQLVNQFAALGGVDGAISKIKDKLATDPSDAEGWFILGKLYLAEERYAEAKSAFTKAHDLEPNNPKFGE